MVWLTPRLVLLDFPMVWFAPIKVVLWGSPMVLLTPRVVLLGSPMVWFAPIKVVLWGSPMVLLTPSVVLLKSEKVKRTLRVVLVILCDGSVVRSVYVEMF